MLFSISLANIYKYRAKGNMISADEIENLKTKEFTKKFFKATDYPAVANNVADNMGNSTHKRYRSKALCFNDSDIYFYAIFRI